MATLKSCPEIKTVKQTPVMIESENGNVVVCYNRFDAGLKYKIWSKRWYYNDNFQPDFYWEYTIAFGTIGEANRYIRQMYDGRCFA